MQLNFRALNLQLVHPWAIARGRPSTVATTVIAELTAADGTTGIGEAAPTTRYKESPKSVTAFFGKVDPRGLSFKDIGGSMTYLDTVSPHDMSAKCALNLALLDGAAKRARKPAHEFLGLGFRENSHISSFTIGIDTPEVVRQKVAEAARFPILKLKMGLAGDRETFQALREIAPAKPVRVDANEAWKTKEQALEQIEWLARDGNVQYVEQPMPATASVKDWLWLKQRSPLPIFADESYHVVKDLAHVQECFHGVNVKLVKTGGLSAGLEALQAARKAGLKTMIGCMIETSVLISAAAHLADLCDYLDLDGSVLIKNDPYEGVSNTAGGLSFVGCAEPYGLQVRAR